MKNVIVHWLLPVLFLFWVSVCPVSAAAAGEHTMFRMQDPLTKDVFYVAGREERDLLADAGMLYSGCFLRIPALGTEQIWQLCDLRTGQRFFTNDPRERERLMAEGMSCQEADTEQAAPSFADNGQDHEIPAFHTGKIEKKLTANWIWHKDHVSANNWVCARKTFVIDDTDALAARIPAVIEADSKYWLWINGQLAVNEGSVKRGPTREDTYADQVDIRPYLSEGKNTVAVLAWYYGDEDPYYSYHSSGQAGFLMEADLGNGTSLQTDGSWKLVRHTGYLSPDGVGSPGPSENHRLPEENILYSAEAAGSLLRDGREVWMEPDYDDSAWDSAVVLGKAGDQPWNDLYEREIPFFTWSEEKDFVNGEVLEPYQEQFTTKETVIDLALPENLQIAPVLELEAASAGLTIGLYPSGAAEGPAAGYRTCDGIQKWNCRTWYSAQRLRVVLPAGVRIIHFRYVETGYDTEVIGSFASEDPELDQLWQESVNTLQICMRDTFMDCPDRERVQWWGDVTLQMQEALAVLDPKAQLLYKKGVYSMFGWTDTEDPAGPYYNVLKTVVPNNKEDGCRYELPQQQLFGIVGFWDYYMQTGDRSLLQEVYPYCINYLRLWEQRADGLVDVRKGTMYWGDWGSGQDLPVLENAWYFWACSCVRNMAAELGIVQDHDFLFSRLTGIRRAFDAAFWTGYAYYGETEDKAADDRAQAVAVLAGLAGQDRYDLLADILQKVQNSGPYMENFVDQALYEMGYGTAARERMTGRYAGMLDDEWSTLWEQFRKPDETGKENLDTHNHAWSSGPILAMSRYIAGVRPTRPGYAAWQVIPQRAGLSQYACTVPTGKGSIQVIMTADSMTVSSPGGCSEIWVPVTDHETVAPPGGCEHEGRRQAFGQVFEVFAADKAGTYMFVIKG